PRGKMSLGATARCRQSKTRRIGLALLISSLLILTCPSPSRAQTLAHPPILIVGDSFTPDNGVTNGNGTIRAPYIIENWEITADVIANNQNYNNTKDAVWATSTFNSIITDNEASTNRDKADGEGFVIGVSSNNIFENNTVSSITFYEVRTIFSTDNVFRNNNI